MIKVPDAAGKGSMLTNGNTVCNIILRIWLIIDVYNSKKEGYNYFPKFSNETCVMPLTSFNTNDKPWIYLTLTLHGLLHHTWEFIQGNYHFGLQEYSEHSIEGDMRFITFNKEFLTRKLT